MLTLSTMNNDNKNISRRAFFRQGIKRTLPILVGAMIGEPIFAQICHEATSCESNCYGTCYVTCRATCTGTCCNSCYGKCWSSCTNTCEYSCGDACTYECKGSCNNQCVNTCKDLEVAGGSMSDRRRLSESGKKDSVKVDTLINNTK